MKTKFQLNKKPWGVKYDTDEHRYMVFQSEEPITEIHIVIYDRGKVERPYYGPNGKEEYPYDTYPTREEAVKAALKCYKADIDQLKADISYIEWKMGELENE